MSGQFTTDINSGSESEPGRLGTTRKRETGYTSLSSKMEKPRPNTVVIGMDDTEFCYDLLRWTLDYLFDRMPTYRLLIAHAQRRPVSLARLCCGPPDYETVFGNDLTPAAHNIIERTKNICLKKGGKDPLFDIMFGDVEKVLRKVAIANKAIILVVGGSHEVTGFMKRLFIGSVAESCARKANYAVMIVKEPKINGQPDTEPEINQQSGTEPGTNQPPGGETETNQQTTGTGPESNQQPGRGPKTDHPRTGTGPESNQQPGRGPETDQAPGREPEVNPQPGGDQPGNWWYILVHCIFQHLGK